jgi:hypothetical protein
MLSLEHVPRGLADIHIETVAHLHLQHVQIVPQFHEETPREMLEALSEDRRAHLGVAAQSAGERLARLVACGVEAPRDGGTGAGGHVGPYAGGNATPVMA